MAKVKPRENNNVNASIGTQDSNKTYSRHTEMCFASNCMMLYYIL